ncbi:MAG: ArnT family glycosyltransferase [Aureliella sp.]
MPNISISRLLILLVLSCIVFLTQLGAARLWDRDEPRNSRASHEMLARGDWVVPTFNGELRDHKPILLYWGQMVCYQLLGESEFAARLPSALSALLTVLVVALLATRLSGGPATLNLFRINRTGFWAASALATSLLFVMAGRAATPDACLIVFSTLGITALALASTQPDKPFAVGRVGNARWLPALFGYTMFGLAALAKGPVGIILPLAVVHCWWMLCRASECSSLIEPEASRGKNWSTKLFAWANFYVLWAWQAFNPMQCLRAVWALRVLPGLAVALIAAAPWYIAVGVATDGAFLRGFFIDHNVGRAMGAMEGHNGSLLFYPLALLVGTFPWSLWALVVLIWCRRAYEQDSPSRQLILLAGSWVAVYVGAFSLASTKLPSYITPCYAGVALAIGGFLTQFELQWSMPSIRWRTAANSLAIFVGVGLTIAFVVLSRIEQMPNLVFAAAAGVVLAVCGVICLGLERFSSGLRWTPAIWLGAAVVVQVVLFGYGAATVDSYRQELDVVVDLQKKNPNDCWVSIGGMEPSWVHYLDQQMIEVKDSAFDSACWEQVNTILEQKPEAYFLVAGSDAIDFALDQLAETHEVTLITSGKRFLKSGDFAVFRCKVPSSINARTAGANPVGQAPISR